MTILTDYPSQVRETLSQLAEALDQSLGNGYSLCTYGGLSQRRFQPERRAINVALIVDKLSEDVLRTLRAPMATALRRCHIDVFMIEYAQLSRIADSFAVKLLEIQRHHAMLRGTDPFAALVINPELVRLRLEQESRNHLMRLRRSFLLAGDSPESLALAMRNSVSSLLGECEAILSLLGLVSPDDIDSFIGVVAERLRLDFELLKRLVEFRGVGTLDQIQSTYFELLHVVEQVTLFVDGLEQKA